MDGNGGGLICSSYDFVGENDWGCFGDAPLGANGTAIGTGQQNTNVILAGCTETGIAAYLCDTLNHNGYSDWFLPSRDELYQIYLSIGPGGIDANDNIAGFNLNWWYWSSSEYNGIKAWNVNFLNGDISNGNKDNPFKVRVIRSF